MTLFFKSENVQQLQFLTEVVVCRFRYAATNLGGTVLGKRQVYPFHWYV